MMDWLNVLVLSLVQGLTEFLPISSSAHLILVPLLSNWPDQGLAFDVAVHFGTLLAILCYFRNHLFTLCRSFNFKQPFSSPLSWVALATIPVALVGLIAHDFIASQLRTPFVMMMTTLLFGLLLGYSDRNPRNRPLNFKTAMIIGLWQVLALIPGTSRSGITITAALLMGVSRSEASRFSFLLAIPVIILATGYESLQLLMNNHATHWPSLLLGCSLSFISALACIHFFLKFIDRIGMMPFVIYRIGLAAFLAYFILIT